MKIVIIGGHLSPALSLIDEIGEKHEILFIGRKFALEGDRALSLEYKIATERNLKFESITTGRIQRSITRHTLLSILKIPVGFYQSTRILKRFKPDVVVGFGGYVSIPVTFSAFLLRIPVVIHEQTLEAGFANKIESLFANKVCISFETSRNFFPKDKTILTGNPIRSEITDPHGKIELPSESTPLIYITGGSLGSSFINSLVEKNLKTLLTSYRIVHQVGSANGDEYFNKLREIKKGLSNELRRRYLLSQHFSANEVGLILRDTTLVIGRAGINTITELLYLNKPALLIPLPSSQRQEQLKNASFIRDMGLARILMQKGLTSDEFISSVSSMIENINSFKSNENKEYLKENAANSILEVIENVSEKDNQKTS